MRYGRGPLYDHDGQMGRAELDTDERDSTHSIDKGWMDVIERCGCRSNIARVAGGQYVTIGGGASIDEPWKGIIVPDGSLRGSHT